MQRVGGTISLQKDGEILQAKGAFTYNLGKPKRETVKGSDNRVHGFFEAPQPAFIEGAITDSKDLDLGALQDTTDATVTLELANGKVIVCRSACYAHEGTGNTEQGEIPVRFEGDVEEVR